MFGANGFVLMEEAGNSTAGGGNGEIDMDATIDSLATELGLKADDAAASSISSAADGEKPAASSASPGTPTARQPPKSWAQEKHELWSKLDQATQEYIELREKQVLEGFEKLKPETEYAKALRGAIDPYKPLLEAQGIKEPAQAVQWLLNAHYQLSHGDEGQRLAAFNKLASYYGFKPEQLAKAFAGKSGDELPYTDPRVEGLEKKLENFERVLTTEQRERIEAARAAISRQVEAFAADTKHPYFDEAADDIVRLINAGYNLEEAYEKAVWANPVTRQKQLEQQQKDAVAKAQQEADEKAKAALKAKGTEVHGRESSRSPTETLGSMDQTLEETMAKIKARS